MSIKNPIQFISRTFNTILNDINSDSELVDKPNWFKRIWAGIGDVLSMWVNAMGNNLVLRTAYTRQNVADLLELIDYNLSPQSTAEGNVIFYAIPSASLPFAVSIVDSKVQTSGSLVISSKIFESRNSITFPNTFETFLSSAVNASTDIITVTREYTTGEKIIFTGADLPDPIVSGTEYWVISVSSTTIRISVTLADAYSGVYIDLIDVGSGTNTITLYSYIVNMHQQETQNTTTVGTSDGVSEWQTFSLIETDILEDTVVVVINGSTYTKVDTLVYSTSVDEHFEISYSTDNIAQISFGNGTYGIIPPAFDIEVTFAIGGGLDSNVSAVDSINVYAGGNANISGVSNPASLTGGSDSESIESGKRLGPLLLKTRDRFVTTEDGQALSEDYGGVAQVLVNGNAYGVLSAQVVIIPNGGGTTTTVFKDGLDDYLTDRTVLKSIDVRVEDATYLTQNVNSSVKVLDGYTFAGISDYVSFAWSLFFSEAGFEIKRDYEENGIDSAITLINAIFTKTYGTDDIEQIQNLLEELDPRTINKDIQESDALGYIDTAVFGVDYVTASSPSFPILVGANEITTDGTITLGEI